MKELDAPGLILDVCFNLLDWSSQNMLCVAVENLVNLWSPCTGKVTGLCELYENITSVGWNQQESHDCAPLFLCRTVKCISAKSEFDYWLL
jgi:cell division cycle 20-like protein 1 (cofactor of APC complex)